MGRPPIWLHSVDHKVYINYICMQADIFVSGYLKYLHIGLTLELLVLKRSYHMKLPYYHLEEIQIF